MSGHDEDQDIEPSGNGDRYEILIDQGHDALDSEDFELAVDLGREAIELEPDDPEGYFVAGIAFLELGEFQRALDYLKEANTRDPDDPQVRTYYAEARFILGEDEEAEKLLRSAVRQDPESAEAHYILSMVVERRGRPAYAEADQLLADCVRLDPERFHAPYRMGRSELEHDLEEVVSHLPAPIAAAIKGVPIVIEDLPSRELLHGEEHLAPDILGLFVGTARDDVSVFTPAASPDIVYIFKRNLERVVSSREELIEEARTTLIHEIGHYLGLEEDDLAERGLD